MLWVSRMFRSGLAFVLFTMLLLQTTPAAASHPTEIFGDSTNAPAGIPNSAVTLYFNVIAVKADESVTIRTKDFPMGTNFVARMDTIGNKATNGAIVGKFNSGGGGKIEMTFPIPENLRGRILLWLRLDSVDGYQASNWFFNETTVQAPNPNAKPEMTFSDVKKGTSVTVEAKNLPPNTDFSVRVGPYYTFLKDYVFSDMVTTGSDGTVKFTLEIPKPAQNADYIMVRMDHERTTVSNQYQNVDKGAAVTVQKLTKFNWCKVINIAPVPDLDPSEPFDAVWTVQNVSNSTWKAGTFAYKYNGGEQMQKYKDFYNIGWDIKDGWTFDIAVDMIAPQTPG